MTWKDDLQPMSFNGVGCYHDEASKRMGRRVAQTDLPLRNETVSQDMGRARRTGRLSCFVVGPDYLVDLKALEAEFEKGGEATLVHPYFGKMQVELTHPVEAQITLDKGGMARFVLQYRRISGSSNPSPPDTLGPLLSAAGDARSALTKATKLGLVLAATQAFVTKAARKLFTGTNGAIGAMQKARGKVNSAAGFVDDLSSSIDAFSHEVDNLVSLPGELADKFQTLMRKTMGLLVSSGDAQSDLSVGALAQLAGSEDVEGPPIEITTPSRQQQADNQVTILTLVHGSAAIEATVAIAESKTLGSRQRALKVLEQLEDALLAVAETSLDDDVFQSFSNLAAATRRHLTETSTTLPSVGTFTPAGDIPALVLAYRLYGDASREADIVDRNNIPHPGAIPGGEPLEVLSV